MFHFLKGLRHSEPFLQKKTCIIKRKVIIFLYHNDRYSTIILKVMRFSPLYHPYHLDA